MIKIVDTVWWTLPDGDCYGIVWGTTEVGERKAYMGKGLGKDMNIDAQIIAARGMPVNEGHLKSVLNFLEKRNE